MKQLVILTILGFFSVLAEGHAATVFGDRNGRVSVESSYGGRGLTFSFSTTRSITSYHTYANYGSLGSNRGGHVSLPSTGPIHTYNDSGNDRIVTIPYKKIGPIKGNFGKAYSRGYRF